MPIDRIEISDYELMGRKVLEPPEDIDDPLFLAKRRAYQQQRKLIEESARRFTQSGFPIDEHHLALSVLALLPTAQQQSDFLIAAH